MLWEDCAAIIYFIMYKWGGSWSPKVKQVEVIQSQVLFTRRHPAFCSTVGLFFFFLVLILVGSVWCGAVLVDTSLQRVVDIRTSAFTLLCLPGKVYSGRGFWKGKVMIERIRSQIQATEIESSTDCPGCPLESRLETWPSGRGSEYIRCSYTSRAARWRGSVIWLVWLHLFCETFQANRERLCLPVDLGTPRKWLARV